METVDLLQIKIEKARGELSEDSRNAIDAIPWKAEILKMRAEKGYSYTQLEDLETETELLLCGLLNPEDYPKELEKRMGIPKPKVDELVNEMNMRVFSKIREELVKIIERKKIPESKEETPKTPDLSIPELTPTTTEKTIENQPETPSILEQKLSGVVQAPKTETNHSLGNLSSDKKSDDTPRIDPYRMPIE